LCKSGGWGDAAGAGGAVPGAGHNMEHCQGRRQNSGQSLSTALLNRIWEIAPVTGTYLRYFKIRAWKNINFGYSILRDRSSLFFVSFIFSIFTL
jgi:hypothetical protein